MAKAREKAHGGWQDRVSNWVLTGLIRAALLLPPRRRMRFVTWVVSRLIAPLTPWKSRARANLKHVWPDLPEDRAEAIAKAAINNMARAFIEAYDVPDFLARGARAQLSGPGVKAAEDAHAAGRPVLFLTAHYGSAEGGRCALVSRGFKVGGLYRPMSNPYFNAHYARNMHTICEPVFEQGRRGTMGLIKHIRDGGMGVLLFDVYDSAGVPIDFLGQPAPTLTSAADIALRADALLIPFFGIRKGDGYDFDVVLEEPIPPASPEAMMVEATRRLEAHIDADPGQWFWIHRRWKPKRQAKRQRKRAAAMTRP